jgi:type II secretory ATPase GspE/PulE/Tfp pilus assembly ATPase PilB-like protein
MLLAELLLPHDPGLAEAILARAAAGEIRQRAVETGMISLAERGLSAIKAGDTSAQEIRRVLGFRPWEALA